MTRSEQLDFLIRELSPAAHIPVGANAKWRLFRALVNGREAAPIGAEFLRVQDEMLRAVISERGITDADSLAELRPGLCLWRGDITTLKVDAIVNAANSALLGCFLPGHSCIDNAIHTFAGVQLRLNCAQIMHEQGHSEPSGEAKITPAYNLPSRYILHTVGPIVGDTLTDEHRQQLRNCYQSCLEIAEQHDLSSVAFCCISTGVFHFPNRQAAEIAVDAVSGFLKTSNHVKKVIFNVFTDQDEQIYRQLLS